MPKKAMYLVGTEIIIFLLLVWSTTLSSLSSTCMGFTATTRTKTKEGITAKPPSIDDLWKQAGATSKRKRQRGRKPVVQPQHMPKSIRTRNHVGTTSNKGPGSSSSSNIDLIPKEAIHSMSLIQQEQKYLKNDDGDEEDDTATSSSINPIILANVTLMNGTQWIVPPNELHQRQHQSVWLEVRSLLDITASEFSSVFGRSFFNTREQLLERKVGSKSSNFVGGNRKAMEWGLRMEPKAFRQYCDVTGNIVEETGLHITASSSSSSSSPPSSTNDDRDGRWTLGASPDGLVVDRKDGSLGLLEIKCLWGRRNKKKEMPQYDNCPNRFFDQIQGQLAVCDREWCDLMLYVPPSNKYRKNYCIIRVERNRKFWSESLLPELERFCAEVDEAKKRR